VRGLRCAPDAPRRQRAGWGRVAGWARARAAVHAGDPAADLCICSVTLHSARCAIQAHSDTLRARRLDPEVEQRLQALLVDRVAPLLLRYVQLGKHGARRLRTPFPARLARCIAGSRGRRRPRGAPPRLRAAPRVAGPRRVPAALACVAASALGELLSSKGLCARVPGEERECGMRSLYAMLQWASQRVADLVRVRGARAHRQRPPVPGGTRGARRGRRRAGRQPAAHACRRRPTRVSQRRA